MITCPMCAEDVTPTNGTCPECGHAFEAKPQPPARSPEKHTTAVASEDPKPLGLTIPAAIGVLVLLALFVLVVTQSKSSSVRGASDQANHAAGRQLPDQTTCVVVREMVFGRSGPVDLGWAWPDWSNALRPVGVAGLANVTRSGLRTRFVDVMVRHGWTAPRAESVFDSSEESLLYLGPEFIAMRTEGERAQIHAIVDQCPR